MRLSYKIALLLVALALATAVVLRFVQTSHSTDTRKANVTLVRVESPQRQTVARSVQLTGDVLPVQQAQIFSKVYGTLERVYVDLGDYVREGQLLASIDSTELVQQCRQAAATYENTKNIWARAQQLANRDLSAKQEFDNVDAALKVATANYENAKTRLGYTQITAPFCGYITRRYLDPGAVLTANNATLLTLMDLNSVKIILNVQERDVPLIAAGVKATVAVDALPERQFTGNITRLGQALDLATRTMPVELDIANPDHLLKPGMFATVALRVTEHPNALTLPIQALLKDSKGSYVYIADNGIARRKDVTIGMEQQSRTEILSGLEGGEAVITTGQQLVKDSGQIAVQK